MSEQVMERERRGHDKTRKINDLLSYEEAGHLLSIRLQF